MVFQIVRDRKDSPNPWWWSPRCMKPWQTSRICDRRHFAFSSLKHKRVASLSLLEEVPSLFKWPKCFVDARFRILGTAASVASYLEQHVIKFCSITPLLLIYNTHSSWHFATMCAIGLCWEQILSWSGDDCFPIIRCMFHARSSQSDSTCSFCLELHTDRVIELGAYLTIYLHVSIPASWGKQLLLSACTGDNGFRVRLQVIGDGSTLTPLHPKVNPNPT